MTKNVLTIALLVLGFSACAPSSSVSQIKPTQVIVLQAVGVLSTGVTSKVGGIARFKELSNGSTIVEVEITNLPPEKRSAGYIRVGSCSNPGGIAATLTEMTSDLTMIADPAMRIYASPHALRPVPGSMPHVGCVSDGSVATASALQSVGNAGNETWTEQLQP